MSKAERIYIDYFDNPQSLYGIIRTAVHHLEIVTIKKFDISLFENNPDILEGKVNLNIRDVDGDHMLEVIAVETDLAGSCSIGSFVEVIYDGLIKDNKSGRVLPHLKMIDHDYFGSLGDDWDGDYF